MSISGFVLAMALCMSLGPMVYFAVLLNMPAPPEDKQDLVNKMLMAGAWALVSFNVGLMVYRAFIVEPSVPKPRFYDGTINVSVKRPVNVPWLKDVADELVPQCDFAFEYLPDSAITDCDKFEVTPARGQFVAVKGRKDDNGKVKYLVEEDENSPYWNGSESVPAGKIVGACIRAHWPADDTVPSTSGHFALMWAHELTHLCGYEHAVGDATNSTVNYHVMSADMDKVGYDNRGLTYGNSESYTPEVSK